MDEIEKLIEVLEPFAAIPLVYPRDGSKPQKAILEWDNKGRAYNAEHVLAARKALDILDAALAQLAAVPEVDDMREALQQIDQWCSAYPVKMFPEPDLVAVRTVLIDYGMEGQIDRMHASWARHLTEGIRKIARAALRKD